MIIILPLTDDFNTVSINNIAICELRLLATLLASLRDFGRLVCALERTPLPAFSLQFNRHEVLAVQTDIINGRPVIYYTQEDSKDGQYWPTE